MFDSLSFVNDDTLKPSRKSNGGGTRNRYNTIVHNVTGAWWVSVGLLKSHLLSDGKDQQVVMCRPNAKPSHAPRIIANGNDMTLFALAKLCGLVWAYWSGYTKPGVYAVQPLANQGKKWSVGQMENKFNLLGATINAKGYRKPGNPMRDCTATIDAECQFVLDWMRENNIADVNVYSPEAYAAKRKSNGWPEYDTSDFDTDQVAVLELVEGEPQNLPQFDSLDWSDFDCVVDNNAALAATV